MNRYHNKAYLYFDDEMMKEIKNVVSDMIITTNENRNISDGVRYLIEEGLKNFEFYKRYDNIINYKKKYGDQNE